MIRPILWGLALLIPLLLVQTTLMNFVTFWGVKPNLLLIVFVIFASQNGSYPSMFVGFLLGISIDFLTMQPMGFHSFVYCLAGYLFGLGKGKVYFDPVVVPLLIGIVATAYETVLSFVVSSIFNLGSNWTTFFNAGFFIQVAFNLALSPLVFFVFTLFKQRFEDPRRGFGG